MSGQTGEMERLVNWINDAWMDIALLYSDWKFLLRDVSFALVAGQRSYPYASAPASITDFGSWKKTPRTWRRYLTAQPASENFLQVATYGDFKDYYEFGSRRTETGDPIVISFSPTDALLVGPTPNATGYTLVGEYYARPTDLVVDGDTPNIPTEYHRAIVYRAMMYYGAFEAAPEVFQRGQSQYSAMLSKLTYDQRPSFEMAEPLA